MKLTARVGMSELRAPRALRRVSLLSLLTLSALLGLSPEARARCALAPVELKRLGARLEGSASRAAWAEIWSELTALEARLTQRAEAGSTPALTPERAVTLECLYGLQFDASFYLSGARLEAPLWSARGLGAKLLLEALEAQSERRPSRGSLAQRALRAQEMQRALARRPKTRARGAAWMSAKGSVLVKIPALKRPVTLSVQHPNAKDWSAQCGLSKGCEGRPSWTINLPAGREATLSLPKADYALQWSGFCADERGTLPLLKGSAKQVTLSPPALACRSEVTLIDPRSNERWPAGVVLEGETKTFTRAGYQDSPVTGREGGGPVTVELKRCELPITWAVTPAYARVEAPKAVPWGVPSTIRVSAPGYAPLARQIELDRPERCDPEPHHLDLAMSRALLLTLTSQSGRPLKATSLQLGGLTEPTSGLTRRPPGVYGGRAQVEGFQPLTFTLRVPPCDREGYIQSEVGQGSRPRVGEGRCLPYERSLKLSALQPPPTTTAEQLERSGLVTAGLGLTLLTTHVLGLMDYQSLSYSQSLADKRGALARGQLWSYGLIGSGALLYGLGKLWPELSSPSAPQETSP